MQFQKFLPPAMLAMIVSLATFPAWAAEDVDSLLRLVPPGSNTLAVVRVREVLESPRAKREGWKGEKLKFLAGADTVPNWVDALVVGAQFHPGSSDNWSASLLSCPAGVSVEAMAKSENRALQQLGGVPAMHTHRDAYFLQLKPDVLGVMNPALRQQASRWARDASAATAPRLSEFLRRAATASSHIVMAIDMQDMLDPQLIRQRLEATESLKGKTEVIEALEKLFKGLQGVAFFAQIDEDTDARIDLVFSEDLPDEGERLKGLLLEMLADQRLVLEDFREGQASVRGAVLTVKTKLSDAGLRRILSLILSPYPESPNYSGAVAGDAPALRPAEPTAPRPAEIIRRNREYYIAVQRALKDLQFSAKWSANYAQAAGWFERYADKIDNLPRASVDEDLTNYAADVSSKLRALAATTRGMVVDVNAAQATLTYSTNVGFAPWGGGWGWGWGMAPHWSVNSNLSEVRAAQAQAVTNSAKQVEEIRKYLLDQSAAIRRQMEQKYGDEFSKWIF